MDIWTGDAPSSGFSWYSQIYSHKCTEDTRGMVTILGWRRIDDNDRSEPNV